MYVDVLVVRGEREHLEFLCLRRSPAGRSPGSWEAVHGHVESGEPPAAAARREVQEEAGVAPERLYNLSRVESFYRHSVDEIVQVPVFVAFLAASAEVRLSREHDAFEWLTPEAARSRMSWPRVRREIDDAVELLGAGGAGVLEDVLRVP